MNEEAPPPLQPAQANSPTEDEKMPPYDEETQAIIDAAQEARSKFEEVERSLKEMVPHGNSPREARRSSASRVSALDRLDMLLSSPARSGSREVAEALAAGHRERNEERQ